MPTYRNQKPLSLIPGVIFLLIGLTVAIVSLTFIIPYMQDKIKVHHGTPVFFGISLIIISAGTFMTLGTQTINTSDTEISKTLKLFGLKLVNISIPYQQITRIETANQTDIRIIHQNTKTLIIDSLTPEQFQNITKTLETQTNLPST